MEFLGIGPLELLVILVVALLVLGPERLMEVARSLGKTASEVRQSINKARRDLTVTLQKEPPSKEERSSTLASPPQETAETQEKGPPPPGPATSSF